MQRFGKMGNATAMIKFSSNISVVVKARLDQIQELKNNPDPVLRTVAMAILPEVKHRVHVEGKDSAGQQIGIYSPGYMVVRTGAYKNADRVSRGPNIGKLKNSGRYTDRTIKLDKNTGVFSGDEKVGTARPRYNRSSDTKVILSLTRQMENDMSVIASGSGYGIGYLNPLNYQKAIWCEETYKKPILTKLTPDELAMAKETAESFLTEYLK